MALGSIGRAIGTILSPINNAIKGIRSKLEVLDMPNAGADFGALTYPLDTDVQSGHFIMFHVVETTPGSGQIEASDDKAIETLEKFRGRFRDTANVGNTNLTPLPRQKINDIAMRQRDTRDALVKANASVSELTKLKQFEVRSQTVATIVIYMPEKITTGYSLQYEGESLRIAAAGSAILEATKDVLGGATTLSETVKGDLAKALGQEFGTRLATDLLDQLGSLVGANVGARAFLERNIRQVRNPHMQFLFRSVNQRTFEYTFKFVATSDKESEIIDNIIRTFKFFAHPELLGAGRLHAFPAEFDIQYVSRELKEDGTRGPGHAYHFQENDWLNRVGRCYLDSIAVDYSGTGVFATHRHHESTVPETLQGGSATNRSGNPPTHVTLSLVFKELETLNRQHILEGF